MIKSFRDSATEELFHRRRCAAPWRQIERVARRKLDAVHAAARIDDLRVPPGNRLENLGGDRRDQWSVRINDRWRVCFNWSAGDATNVEITDYH